MTQRYLSPLPRLWLGAVVAGLALSGCGVTVTLPPGSASSVATTPAPPPTAASQASPPGQGASPGVPPDGNSADVSQAAWITVPSANTKSNALVLDQHTDYQCPYCEITEASYATLFEQLNTDGSIILRQHIRTFLDGINKGANANSSTRAAVAAACVDVADDTKYAAYHNAIYANSPKTEGDGFTDQQLRADFAQAVGLTGQSLATFQSCYDSQATMAWVSSGEKNNQSGTVNATGSPKYLFGGNAPLCYVQDAQGRYAATACTTTGAVQAGVLGTPTFFVNGAQFGLDKLFDNNFKPLYTTAPALLAFLQTTANQ